MNETQMLLFRNAPEAITEAIKTLNENTVLLPNYQDFVRQLGTRIITLPPGSVILAALPGAVSQKEVLHSLQQHMDEAHSRGVGGGSVAMASMSVPPTLNTKAQHHALLDGYRSGPRFSNVRRLPEHQLRLEFDSRMTSSCPFQVTSSILSQRVSTSCYLIQDAHLLQRAGASFNEGAQHVRFIMQMAAASERTQILMGHVAVLSRWLKYPEIANGVAVCALKPYDLDLASNRTTFLALLEAYEKLIPWSSTPLLKANLEFIHERVQGCPYRLKLWMREALSEAQARGNGHLDWATVEEFVPVAGAQESALDDYRQIFDLRHRPESAHQPKRTAAQANGAKPKFSRSLKRPQVGFANN